MAFSSLLFVFFFLPCIISIYFLSKEKYRNYIMLSASLLFYAYGEPEFVLVMIGSIAINYTMAIWISRVKRKKKSGFSRTLLFTDIIINIGILFIYKYLDFSIHLWNQVFHTEYPVMEIALPIGISFFTFQALSYVIDVYRGRVSVQKNPLYVALYISFFPQLIAGPIVRYSTIEAQITARSCDLKKFANGTQRFFLGFAKKVILANNLSVIAAEIFAKDSTIVNPVVLWLGSISYSLQIFYDFSGYSDMAIGLGKLFGFDFEENFSYPYISRSITEFWRRWHISLGTWFRDYVYIPMGGSRVNTFRHLFNMLVVWLLTGIWHGAAYTFIAWGLGYFVLLAVEKYIVKPEKRENIIIRVLWQIFTLLCVNFGWVIFNADGLKKGIQYIFAMVGGYGVSFMMDENILRYVREYGFFLVAGIVFATPVMKNLKSRREQSKLSDMANILLPVGYGVIFLWAVSFIILGAHNPFIYFNF